MSRAPETGFYFEPISGRLALLRAGAVFPSPEAWAHVGDPARMSEEAARQEVALRWPGVDPESLEVEEEPATAGRP
jgi:hypothetical protein